MPVRKCQPGCTCGKHIDKTCPAGCTCAKHACRLSPEQREASRQRKLAADRDRERARYREDPETKRERNKLHGPRYHLKSVFGITPERRDEMFAAQEGCCYLCSEPLIKGRIHIDHDRACCRGRRSCGSCIRGLACQLCNQGIGQFGDDPERMRRVADNLEMANRRLRDSARTGLMAGSNAPAGR